LLFDVEIVTLIVLCPIVPFTYLHSHGQDLRPGPVLFAVENGLV